LSHLSRMTDSTGIFQHAIFSNPEFSEGYCTDDNARAFILAVLLSELEKSQSGCGPWPQPMLHFSITRSISNKTLSQPPEFRPPLARRNKGQRIVTGELSGRWVWAWGVRPIGASRSWLANSSRWRCPH